MALRAPIAGVGGGATGHLIVGQASLNACAGNPKSHTLLCPSHWPLIPFSMASSSTAEPHSHTHAQDEDPDDLIPSDRLADTTTATTAFPSYKINFLQACLSAQVFTFGTFTLKSGRVSPYFFNAGLFHRYGSTTNQFSQATSHAYHFSLLAF